jgi:hypothetical protein
MRNHLTAMYLRVLIALMSLASFASVIEAGHRWR